MRSAFAKFGCVCAIFMLCQIARADMVENPAYKAWSSCGAGSSATLTMKSEAAGQSSTVQIKQTLQSVDDDKAVIQSVTTMTMNGQNITTPAQTVEIKKMVDTNAQAGGPSKSMDPKVLENAPEESVTVAAGTFKAKVIELSTNQNGSTYKSKIWFSKDVPGGMVKMEINGDGPVKMTSSSELTALEKK